MYDFSGNALRLGDQVITEKTGRTSSFVAGEVIRLTEGGAKIATNAEMKNGRVWRPSEVLQRPSRIIHLVRHNPEREAELSNK